MKRKDGPKVEPGLDANGGRIWRATCDRHSYSITTNLSQNAADALFVHRVIFHGATIMVSDWAFDNWHKISKNRRPPVSRRIDKSGISYA